MTVWGMAAAGIAVGVGVAAAGTAMAISTANAADATADASKFTASENRRATEFAASEAKEGEIAAAEADRDARMHESNTALAQEQAYLTHEKWAFEHEDSMDAYYRSVQNQVDAIDFQTADSPGSLNFGSEDPYYMGDGGDMTFS